MKVNIVPNELKGDVVIPPSKSLAHRAIIAGSLAHGSSIITNLNFSNDIIVTTQAMKDLGVDIKKFEDYEVITGSKNLKRINSTINCGESGSTIRFMIPISLLADGKVTFVGEGRLATRPLNVFHEIFDKQNIKYNHGVEELPLIIDGKLKAGRFEVRGDISSQFITGLLYTLPKLDGDSEIVITTNLESKGYIDLTLDILNKFGIEIINENYERFIVRGNQEYKAQDYRVEGDFSQVAFWLVAGFLNDGINCFGMNPNSLQGDREIIKILKDMGGDLTIDEDVISIKGKESIGAIVDLSQCPDLGPIVAVLASLSKGTTKIINAGRLRIKESDRITSMTTELNKLGAKIIETENGMIIEGVKNLKGGVEVDAWNDHRVAMALAVASSRCDKPIILTGADSVKKSYPNFWKDFEKLNGKIDIIEK